MITDLVGGSSFQAQRLFTEEDRTRWFYRGGTSGPEDIEKIVGQLSLEEVIAAGRRGLEINLPQATEERKETMTNELRKAAQKEPRTIII